MPKATHRNSSQIVQAAVQRLAKLQKANGGFNSYSWSKANPTEQPLGFASVFSTALITDALHHFKTIPKVAKIGQKAATFLVSQKSPHWSFNYWDRTSSEFQKLPYPDDWDDTACSLAALTHWQPELLTAQSLAQVVKLLTLTEVQAGGPYRTWIVNSQAPAVWQDTDMIVNCNIGYFLSLHQVTLPNLVSLMEQQIKNHNWTSPYYPTPYPFFYFLSKWYRGKLVPTLVKQLLAFAAQETVALNQALILSSLCRWHASGAEVARLYEKLLVQPKSWTAALFYTGVNPDHNQEFLAGSEALTIAICVEAIHLFEERTTTAAVISDGAQTTEKLHQQIVDQARKFFDQQPQLRSEFEFWLTKVITSDPQHQITLLPKLFSQTLPSTTEQASREFYQQLGVANLLGWIAYTIYDNFLDLEAQPKDLPIANVCLRYLTHIFNQVLPPETGFSEFFNQTMDQLEAANLWEVIQTRLTVTKTTIEVSDNLPDYGAYQQLAGKSLAHALGPVAVLVKQGYQINSPEVQNVWQFFTQYLIVRQLNDDLHDWKADLLRGQLNPVSSHLLKTANLSNTKIRKKDIEALEKLFWLSEIEHFCRDLKQHVQLGKKALNQTKIFQTTTPWEALLNKYVKAAEKALQQRDQILEFWQRFEAHN